jgi:ribosomal protein S18 acetylase RimI-like enzyme
LHIGSRKKTPLQKNNILIRLATGADVSPLAALIERYWEFEGIPGFDQPRTEAALGALLSRPEHGTAWVAQAPDSLCGYLIAVYMLSFEHGGLMAEIDELYVCPELRSQGVGSWLVTAAQRDMAAQGLKRLQLQIGVDNARGRAFYERHGFRRRAGFELFDKAL